VDGLSRCVGDAGRFLEDAFTRRPRLTSDRDIGGLLSVADVDGLITSSGLRRPSIRLVRDGELVDPGTWTRRARTGSTWIDDLVHPGKVLEHFAGGTTVVLQSLHRWWAPVSELCRALEADLGHAVQANAYLTPAGATGFDPHHDTHDVFVLQLHGTKEWTVREPVVEAPLARHRSDHAEAARQPVVAEHTLCPGDCLYLPRGFVHSASTDGGASLHLTVGVLATTAHDVLRRLVDTAAGDPRFRRTMPSGYGRDAGVAEAAVADVVAEFIVWLEELDVRTQATAAVERFLHSRRPLVSGQLLELLSVDELGDEHHVKLRDGTMWDLTDDGDHTVLRVADRRLTLPAPVAPALRRLLDGCEHRVGDLGDLVDTGSRLVLVRRLIREGVLTTVDR
jgi:bifunctional lysine-specific demethylase and histidyl-hydroxylase NO66